jgi:hypothetical protein
MTRLITADARKVSGAEFFSAVTGRELRTKEQRAAEWQADCQRYADMIEAGNEWAVPCPCLADARRIVAERAGQLTECRGDPMLKAKRRAA